MLDLIKKGVLMGVGALNVTKEKAEHLIDDLIKKGELAKNDRSEAIKNLLKKVEEHEKIFVEKVHTEVTKTIEKLGIPTKEDFQELEKRINELVEKLK